MIHLLRSPMMGAANTSIADYVWLPVEFNGDMPEIRWRDSWRYREAEERTKGR